MSTLQVALATALGVMVNKTVNQRVWEWLKDHPHRTSADVGKGIRVAHNTCASACKALLLQGNLTVSKEPKKGFNHIYVFHYTAVGEKYERKPMPKKGGVKIKAKWVAKEDFVPSKTDTTKWAVATDTAPVFSTHLPVQQGVTTRALTEQDVSAMSVGDAFATYQALHKMFGGPSARSPWEKPL